MKYPAFLNSIHYACCKFLRLVLFSIFFSLPFQAIFGQQSIQGVVFDSSRVNYVENVQVLSTAGIFAFTDSLGRYTIPAGDRDSLSFFYNGKYTQKFAVKDIADPMHFNISLRIQVKGKYRLLNEVIVFSKSYKQDSLENREQYADLFGYKNPGFSTSIAPGGMVGADINELINIFRFKRNRNLKSFQKRLELQEQEKYIDYRFSKFYVKRVTGLYGVYLDSFVVWYRPDYDFVKNSNELVFNQYILNAYYQFIKMVQVPPAKKAD